MLSALLALPQERTLAPPPRCPQTSDHRCQGHPRFSWRCDRPPSGFQSSQCARRCPKSDASYPTSPFDISVAAAPADPWVPLSSHPCLTLTSGVLTGPGPSLLARLVARLSTVLRPDPPPGRLRRHFPLTVIGGASSTSFPRRAPRASPVDPSPFVPCRRGSPAGESRRVRLVS